MSTIQRWLSEAVRLLRESGRHFKSRQVADARRLIEQALTQLEEQEHADKKAARDRPQKTPGAPAKTPDDDHARS